MRSPLVKDLLIILEHLEDILIPYFIPIIKYGLAYKNSSSSIVVVVVVVV